MRDVIRTIIIALLVFPFIWFGVFAPNLDNLKDRLRQPPAPWATGTE